MVMCHFLFLEAFFLDVQSVLFRLIILFEALYLVFFLIPTSSAGFILAYRTGVASWTELHSLR